MHHFTENLPENWNGEAKAYIFRRKTSSDTWKRDFNWKNSSHSELQSGKQAPEIAEEGDELGSKQLKRRRRTRDFWERFEAFYFKNQSFEEPKHFFGILNSKKNPQIL